MEQLKKTRWLPVRCCTFALLMIAFFFAVTTSVLAQDIFQSGVPTSIQSLTTPSIPSALKMPTALQLPPQGEPIAADAGLSVPSLPLSAFELYVRSLGESVPDDVLLKRDYMFLSTDIRQFGYDLFRRPPSTFAPEQNVPVGPDYLLGPGDEIRISIWGSINGEFAPVIDIDGRITLPTIGVLHLSGLSFAEAKTYLEKEFSRHYKPSQVKINISMGKLRTFRVFVVGKARKPGSYTISSFSALGNALFAAGGPNKVGSMRDIQVKRKGETVVHFDLYDLLLKGNKTKDIRLMPEDVVFIPPIGPLAGIAGNVKSPAIYELKGETSLAALIAMAGGLNDIAFKGRIQIIRIIDNHRQTILEYSLYDMNAQEIRIQAGDVVKVFPIFEELRRVRLSGAVERPGEYGITPDMTIKDLISLSGGLKYYAFSEDAELFRVTPTNEGPFTEKMALNIGRALEGDPEHNITLKDDDFLRIKAVPEWELHRRVTIAGEVRFPGTYSIEKGERLSSLIERAGLTDNAYLRGAIFTRESVRQLQQLQLDESIDRLEQQIISRSASSIEGAISPESAAQEQAAMVQRRALVAKLRAARAKGRLAIDFTIIENLEKFEESAFDLALENGDRLIIPKIPAQIQVLGSVYNQNAFVFDPGGTVETYLTMAGGTTKYADKSELYVLKVDGTAISKRETSSFMKKSLDPGDTIVAPEKLDKVAWLKEIKDITQILFQVAVTTGVLIALF